MNAPKSRTVDLQTQIAFERWVADVVHRHNLSSPERGISPEYIAMALACEPGFALFANRCCAQPAGADAGEPRYLLWIDGHTEGWGKYEHTSIEDCYKQAMDYGTRDFVITPMPIRVGFVELNGETP